jgi:hypothetical protein
VISGPLLQRQRRTGNNNPVLRGLDCGEYR